MKFSGSIEELKAKLDALDESGEWTEEGGKHAFTTKDKGILSWWPSTGTVLFQGQPEAKKRLERKMSSPDGELMVQEKADAVSAWKTPAPKKKIFIVHGHDKDALDQLELALHRMSLDPFVLMNSSGEGKTIIEALEGKIGRDFSTDFGLVLMTPDDMGYAKVDGELKIEQRARQNVILEAGMLLSSLTRSRVAFVVKSKLELPSDLLGVIRLEYKEHIREIVPKLCQRFKEAGFDIDASHIAAASA